MLCIFVAAIEADNLQPHPVQFVHLFLSPSFLEPKSSLKTVPLKKTSPLGVFELKNPSGFFSVHQNDVECSSRDC